LRMGGRNAGQPQRTGQIIEIRGADGEPPYLMRFSDGRTSLVIPGPGAVIKHSEPVQAMGRGSARSGDELAPGLTFRVTGSQRRALVITAAIVTALAAALTGAAAAASNPSGRLTALATGAGAAAFITLYYSLAYAVAYTRCTLAGLRARGVAGRRYLPWERLRDIAVRDYGSSPYRAGPSRPLRIVIVTADDGSRFWLGAPIDGGQGLGDPEFQDKIRQIQDYWRSMRSRDVSPAGRSPADHDPTGSPLASQAGSGIRADLVPGQALKHHHRPPPASGLRYSRAPASSHRVPDHAS